MKLVGIGDLFIPHRHVAAGFAPLAARGVEIRTFDWQLSGFQELQEINLAVEKGGAGAYTPPPAIFDAVARADVLVVQFCPVPAALLEAAPRLKILGVLRAGVENVDVAAATARGVLVLNTPGRNADAVADFTVGLIICEARNIARGHHALKEGRWLREYPNSGHIPDLPGKTVGIVGMGDIGRRVARRLAGFDVRLLAHDPFVKEAPAGITLVDLPTLAAESDFVTVHARLTKETEGLIGPEIIARMKPTAYLVNTSRSGLVDERALHDALAGGRLAGAALDVFGREPPGKDHPLVALPNVTVTPHMAGGSNDAFFNCPKLLAADLARLLDGGEPRAVVNREVLATARARLGE
ncbi:MAG TPA: 2-hydroxyacid dehydrogenase [Anaeromyxobacteraceae bacterium]|nr:2-hydroxyacid dehydrogenase [Anaeromyxobacteraceae bacterium]